MTDASAMSVTPLARVAGDASAPRYLVEAARIAGGTLGLANLGFVVWMIVTGSRQHLAGAVYAFCLALPVLAGVLLAFLAGNGRARVRPMGFARVGLITGSIQATFLAALVIHAAWLKLDGENDAASLLGVRLGLLGLTLACVVGFSLVTSRAATHAFLQQVAHRAVSLGIWVCLAWVGLKCWDRPLEVTALLVPAAFALFALGGISALAVLWTARDRPTTFDAARGVTMAAAALLLGTVVVIVIAAHVPVS
jgi:hypothetical protein